MDDSEFEQLLSRKHAQVVLKVLLDAEDHSYAFNALRDEVNAIITDDSRGAREIRGREEYSPASLSSLLSTAQDAGIVSQYLSDGKKRWRLHPSQLSKFQVNRIRSKNSTDSAHIDAAHVDLDS
ncbi:hypothetical protein [Halorubrum ezzemoulense]|jgi:hypothetical protein|uniref:hypothetical protein n=1 Tax=Halorubrum ezzemoulense TaxID=337243 RepID=UPI00232BA1A5|nr:hypothetical protein [Halorubrum ezzemoulense]MDB2247410.1 hypothetical protein [Halorubrum ezzemoulense]